jgi:hypothetical protein
MITVHINTKPYMPIYALLIWIDGADNSHEKQKIETMFISSITPADCT